MAVESSTGDGPTENGWVTVSLALLAGIIVLGLGVYLVTVLQAPIGPPVDAAPVFIWNTTAAVIAFVLLRRDHALGYVAAIVTGLLVVSTVGLVASGAYGELQPGSSPLGPLSYVGLAVALVGTTLAGWRRRTTGDRAPEAAPTSR